MAVADRYSRLVLWLKVALPLVALAILSTLFFVAETLDPDAAIPYANVDVAKILREQGVTQPSFGAVTSSGIAISLFAEAIRPNETYPEQFQARDIAASLDLPGGTRIRITSPVGAVNAEAQTASLEGGAIFETSAGLNVQTEDITASLIDGLIVAPHSVSAQGPAGQLTAGEMVLQRPQNNDESFLLVFKGGVRLLYTPQSAED